LLAYRRQKDIAHQGGFAAAGNSGDDRQATDRKFYLDVLQIVRPRIPDLDPIRNMAQASPRFAHGMAERRF
jgi:hypothetical protein